MPPFIAYLVNQYPKVSHTFIRREIRALELQGFDVRRIALRGWNELIADPEDERERQRTWYVLQKGVKPLIWATVQVVLRKPVRFFCALALALRMARCGQRPWPYHLVYLAEACCVLRKLESAGAVHLHAHFGTNSAEVVMLVRVLGGPPYSFTVHGPEEFDRA